MHSIWVISDGAAGNRRQALALAAALGGAARELMLRPRAPWSWLAPRVAAGGLLAWDRRARAQLAPPWPGLVIGCGRQAALATRQLREIGGGSCRSVQILDPRCDTRHWDVVIAPRHDGLRGANVLAPLGSLHPIDTAWLADARAAWQHFAHLPAPRIGVLLGGPRRGVALDAAWRSALGATLRALLRQGGSVLITASQRTPTGMVDACLQAIGERPRQVWHGAGDGINPYPGVLAWSDRLLVSPDSVNMLSEAAACGVPLHTVV
ncbi:MAG: mitochondrial fission ELM1 family protein, partial [Metallibacterium scheffleri]